MDTAPALVTALCRITDPFFSATVELRGHCESSKQIMVMHNAQTKVSTYTADGDESLPVLQVSDHDTILIEVRDDDSRIEAIGCYEVQLELVEIYGKILVPKTCSDLILDQPDATSVAFGVQCGCATCLALSESAVS